MTIDGRGVDGKGVVGRGVEVESVSSTAPPPPKHFRIFISYRHDEVSRQIAGHLRTRLEAHR